MGWFFQLFVGKKKNWKHCSVRTEKSMVSSSVSDSIVCIIFNKLLILMPSGQSTMSHIYKKELNSLQFILNLDFSIWNLTELWSQKRSKTTDLRPDGWCFTTTSGLYRSFLQYFIMFESLLLLEYVHTSKSRKPTT